MPDRSKRSERRQELNEVIDDALDRGATYPWVCGVLIAGAAEASGDALANTLATLRSAQGTRP